MCFFYLIVIFLIQNTVHKTCDIHRNCRATYVRTYKHSFMKVALGFSVSCPASHQPLTSVIAYAQHLKSNIPCVLPPSLSLPLTIGTSAHTYVLVLQHHHSYHHFTLLQSAWLLLPLPPSLLPPSPLPPSPLPPSPYHLFWTCLCCVLSNLARPSVFRWCDVLKTPTYVL